uniref:UBP-type domain-containing protein n=1 Tax=Panagrellus redivivus TaxID=6233 RepID=A0A7E4V4E1_PANRE
MPVPLENNADAAIQPETDPSEFMVYEVEPLAWCPHLGCVKPFSSVYIFEKCTKCDSTAENWICLTCQAVNCSRFIKGHAVDHFKENPDHAMGLSICDLSVWCYICESYVHHEALFPAKDVLHLAKFGEHIPYFNQNQ